MRLRWLRAGVLACLVSGGVITPSIAQVDYPRRPVLLLLPLQAGSGSDIAVRTLAERMSASIGQPVLVENVPGAGGLVGAERLARATADGHVLAAFNNGVLTVLPHIQTKAPFDPLVDFAPVGMVALIPSALVVPADLPARSFAEFVARAKEAPGKFHYASVGVGSVQHLGMELVKSSAGIDLIHVPYKGGVQAMLSVVTGETQAAMIGVSVALQHIRSGKVRALAVGGGRRTTLLPDVPTLEEAGLAGVRYEPWLAVYAPRGTPRAVIERLNAEIAKALAPAEIRDRLLSQGLEVTTSTPEALSAIVRAESSAMAKTIKAAGIRSE